MKRKIKLFSMEDHLENEIEELEEKYNKLENTVDTYNRENEKMHDYLQQEHNDLKNIVDSNYALAQTIFTQNDRIFDKLEKRLDHSLKFIFSCIVIVSILLIVIGYIVYSIHFK